MAIVTVVGAGMMGTAIAYPLADNGHSVRLVGTHLDAEIIQHCRDQGVHPRLRRALPPGVRPFFIEELAGALDGAEIIVSGVNSLGVRWIGRRLAPHLRPGQAIIAVTKGLEISAEGEPAILPNVLAGELPESVRAEIGLAAIGGPCIAGELAARRESCVVFASRDGRLVEGLAAVFRTAYYHVWTTTNLVGLEYCAALKNAYAVAVGLVLGMLERAGGPDPAGAHMHNLAAAVFGQACTEIARVLEVVGAPRHLASGLPGAGDLYVTCQGGRTVRFGSLLGMGKSVREAREIMAGATLEGAEIIRGMARLLPRLAEQGRLGPDELPLMLFLIDVLVRGRPPEPWLDRFFGGADMGHRA